MRLKVSKADMYSDMVDAATSPRPPAVSSIATQVQPSHSNNTNPSLCRVELLYSHAMPGARTQTRHTGAVAQVRSPQAAGSKLSKAESVSEAIGKWSNERLVKEYQVLRRKAWGIRNENAKLVAEIQELTVRGHAQRCAPELPPHGQCGELIFTHYSAMGVDAGSTRQRVCSSGAAATRPRGRLVDCQRALALSIKQGHGHAACHCRPPCLAAAQTCAGACNRGLCCCLSSRFAPPLTLG